jgi:LPS-assembly protein
MLYGDYAAQPEIGFLTRREEIMAAVSLKVTQNWVLLGSARYNLSSGQFDQTRVGIGYLDDCLLLSFNYVTYFTYTLTTPVANNAFMLQLSLRTLGPDALTPIGF